MVECIYLSCMSRKSDPPVGLFQNFKKIKIFKVFQNFQKNSKFSKKFKIFKKFQAGEEPPKVEGTTCTKTTLTDELKNKIGTDANNGDV